MGLLRGQQQRRQTSPESILPAAAINAGAPPKKNENDNDSMPTKTASGLLRSRLSRSTLFAPQEDNESVRGLKDTTNANTDDNNDNNINDSDNNDNDNDNDNNDNNNNDNSNLQDNTIIETPEGYVLTKPVTHDGKDVTNGDVIILTAPDAAADKDKVDEDEEDNGDEKEDDEKEGAGGESVASKDDSDKSEEDSSQGNTNKDENNKKKKGSDGQQQQQQQLAVETREEEQDAEEPSAKGSDGDSENDDDTSVHSKDAASKDDDKNTSTNKEDDKNNNNKFANSEKEEKKNKFDNSEDQEEKKKKSVGDLLKQAMKKKKKKKSAAEGAIEGDEKAADEKSNDDDKVNTLANEGSNDEEDEEGGRDEDDAFLPQNTQPNTNNEGEGDYSSDKLLADGNLATTVEREEEEVVATVKEAKKGSNGNKDKKMNEGESNEDANVEDGGSGDDGENVAGGDDPSIGAADGGADDATVKASGDAASDDDDADAEKGEDASASGDEKDADTKKGANSGDGGTKEMDSADASGGAKKEEGSEEDDSTGEHNGSDGEEGSLGEKAASSDAAAGNDDEAGGNGEDATSGEKGGNGGSDDDSAADKASKSNDDEELEAKKKESKELELEGESDKSAHVDGSAKSGDVVVVSGDGTKSSDGHEYLANDGSAASGEDAKSGDDKSVNEKKSAAASVGSADAKSAKDGSADDDDESAGESGGAKSAKDGSGDAESEGSAKKSEWGDDDDDDDDQVSDVEVKKSSVFDDSAAKDVEPAKTGDTVASGDGSDSTPVKNNDEDDVVAAKGTTKSKSGTKTEAQIENEIESKLTSALEKGELDEEQAQELTEEMEEAIEEGVLTEGAGDVIEKELEEEIQTSSDMAEGGVSEGESGDNGSADDSVDTAAEKGVKGSDGGDVATISLSHDKYASNIKVDDPPVVGEVPSYNKGTSSAGISVGGEDSLPPAGSASGDVASALSDEKYAAYIKANPPVNEGSTHTGTTNATKDSSAITDDKGNTFDNFDCEDHPEHYTTGSYSVKGKNVCESLVDRGGCDDLLFTLDVATSDTENVAKEDSTASVGGSGYNNAKSSSSAAMEDFGIESDDSVTGKSDNVVGSVEVASEVAAGSGGVGETLRVEEEIDTAATKEWGDEDDDNVQRRLAGWSADSEDNAEAASEAKEVDGGKSKGWSAASDDDAEVKTNVEVATKSNANASASNDDADADKIVVTIGSRFCPVTCKVVPQCERARDHFDSLKSRIDEVAKTIAAIQAGEKEEEDDDSKDKSEDEVKTAETATGTESDASADGTIASPVDSDGSAVVKEDKTVIASADDSAEGTVDATETTTSKYASTGGDDGEDLPSTGTYEATEEGEEGGSDAVSEGLVVESEQSILSHLSCTKDDATFLYKDKEGFTCDYIAENKPDKCFKLHDGQKVGVVSCPKSCNMQDECEEVKASAVAVSAAGGGADLGGFGIGDEGDVEEADGDDVATTEGVENADSKDVVKTVGNTTSLLADEAVVTCEDDPGFLFKDKPDFSCAFIGEMKPEKCHKLHDGEKVGVVSCPVSCNMVDECRDMYKVSSSVVEVDNSGDDTKIVYSDDRKKGVDEDEDEEDSDVKAVDSDDYDAENKDMNVEVIGVTSEDGVSGSTTGSKNATATSESAYSPGGNLNAANNGWSADSEDSAPATSSTAIDTSKLCKDDPTFLYKEKPDFSCAYIAENKPEKCFKLHNDIEIGVSSCPESCAMVDKCLESAGVTKSGVTSTEGVDDGAVESNKYNNMSDEDASSPAASPVSTGGGSSYNNKSDDGPLTTGGTSGGAYNNKSDDGLLLPDTRAGYVDSVDQDGSANSADGDKSSTAPFGSLYDNEDATKEGGADYTMVTTGTKSMADEIGGFGNSEDNDTPAASPSFESPFGNIDNVDNSYENEDTADDDGAQTTKDDDNDENSVGVPDDSSSKINSMWDTTEGNDVDGGENKLANSWDNAQEGGVGNDEDEMETWKAENGLGSNGGGSDNLEEDWGNGGGVDNNAAWDTSNNLGGSSPASGNEWDNNAASAPSNNNNVGVPSSETTPSSSSGYGWDYDDDDDGFPTGLVIALLAIFIFFVYRKSRSTEQSPSTRDCTNRGGYQRVQPTDHNKKW